MPPPQFSSWRAQQVGQGCRVAEALEVRGAITKQLGATISSDGWRDAQRRPILNPATTEKLFHTYPNSNTVAGAWGTDKLKIFDWDHDDAKSPHCLLAVRNV